MRLPESRWQLFVCLWVGVLIISACANNTNTSNVTPQGSPVPSGGPPAFGWDKSPNAIVVRLDRQVQGEASVDALNRLPLCTIYGNGHQVWVNNTSEGDQVLEAQLDDQSIRSFLDFAISKVHFYSLPDYAANELQPSGQFVVESATINLNSTPRTIQSYAHWPQSEFQTLLDQCTHLTKEPVIYEPTGAWLTVTPSDSNSDSPILWGSNQPFRLTDVANSGKPMWVSGQLLNVLWQTQRQTLGAVRWLDGDKAFRIILQIPGVSRESPTAPAVTPTIAPTGFTLTPSQVPTITSSSKLPTRTATPTPGAPKPTMTGTLS